MACYLWAIVNEILKDPVSFQLSRCGESLRADGRADFVLVTLMLLQRPISNEYVDEFQPDTLMVRIYQCWQLNDGNIKRGR